MYQRIMAHLAGPISIAAGLLATWLTTQLHLGLGHDTTAKAIIAGLTLAAGTTVTWLAHQKWFNNLVHYWNTAEGQAAVAEEQQGVTATAPSTPAESLPRNTSA